MDGGLLLVSVVMPGETPYAEYEGQKVPLYPAPEKGANRWEAALGVPYNKAPGQDKIVVWLGKPGASQRLELPFRIVAGNYRSEVLKVAERHVNPRKKDLLRIQREGAEIRKLYERLTLKKYWQGPFRLPIESPITSPYGTKRVFNGELQSFHQGLDLKAPTGTPIRAASAGEVILAKDLFMTGNTVILDHGYGVFTIYAHMSRLGVKPGDLVKRDQELGLSGMTGRASGPHLHWGAVVQKAKINPVFLTQVMR